LSCEEETLMHNIGKGLVAGFTATIVLSTLMIMKSVMGLMPELNVARMLGNMISDGPSAGWAAHFVIGTVGWGLLFAWLDPYIPGNSYWLRGVVFGIGAWALMMVVVMPMAGAGLFDAKMGIMAPAMTLILHLAFGAVLGGVYGWQRPAAQEVPAAKVASDLPGRARAERRVEGGP
jgi:hypothetical protein